MKHVDIQTAYGLQTESALSAGQPLEPSKTVLRRHGLLDRFDEEPEEVLAELHGGLSQAGDEDRLFALAELSFLHAERTGNRAHYLASAIYAWALLFPGDATGTRLKPSDPRLRLAYDLYNQAVALGLTATRDEDEVRAGAGGAQAPVRDAPGHPGRVRIDVGRLPARTFDTYMGQPSLRTEPQIQDSRHISQSLRYWTKPYRFRTYQLAVFGLGESCGQRHGGDNY